MEEVGVGFGKEAMDSPHPLGIVGHYLAGSDDGSAGGFCAFGRAGFEHGGISFRVVDVAVRV